MHWAHQPSRPKAMPGKGWSQARVRPVLQHKMLKERQVRARAAWLQSVAEGCGAVADGCMVFCARGRIPLTPEVLRTNPRSS